MTDPMRAYMDNVVDLIGDVGWMCQGVFPTEREGPDSLAWVYTVGLTKTFGHPELVVFGLPMQLGQTLLNDLGARISGGQTFEAGHRFTDLTEQPEEGPELALELIAVDPGNEPGFFGVATRYYRERGLPAPTWLQLVWPDKNGLLPWQDGFDDTLREAQPLLNETVERN